MTDSSAVTLEISRKVLNIVDQGLSCGLGSAIPGQMCVEAAVCCAYGLPHSDRPPCVSSAVRAFKIVLNDKKWPTKQARAQGLRRIAIAQLGSAGVVDDQKFVSRLAEMTIRKIVPIAMRATAERSPKHRESLLGAALRCEQEGTKDAANAATYAANVAADDATSHAAHAVAVAAADAAHAAADAHAYADDAHAHAYAAVAAAYAAYAAADAAYAAYAAAYDAANAATYAAYAATYAAAVDAYAAAVDACVRILTMSAEIAIDVLRELGSPGIQYMDRLCPLPTPEPTVDDTQAVS